MTFDDREIVLLQQSKSGPWFALLREAHNHRFIYEVVNMDTGSVDGPYGTHDGAYGALLGRVMPLVGTGIF